MIDQFHPRRHLLRPGHHGQDVGMGQGLPEAPEEDLGQEAYTELLSTIESPSSYDLMNAGHVELCLGNRKQALAYYRNSMSNLSMSPGDLMSAFEEDVPYLCANGIDAGDIPLIRDFLLYQRDPQ